MFARGRESHIPGPDPSATSMVGSTPSSTSRLIRPSLRHPSRLPPCHTSIASELRQRTLSQQAGQTPSLAISREHYTAAVQSRPYSVLIGSGPGRLSPTQVMESNYSPLQAPPVTDTDAVPVSPTLRQANFGLALTGAGCDYLPPTRFQESSGNFQNDITPTVKPDHAAPVISNPDAWSTNGSQHHGNAVSEPRFVGYGEKDPEKHTKRRDRTEDKDRKKDMFSGWNGACFACRKAKRRCKGEEVCNRCRKLRLACVRTCNSCWASKKLCDEKASCKNCQRLGTDCHRPSAPTIIFGDSQADDLPPPPTSPQLAHTKSTASVNNHTMLETGSAIDAPLAWRMSFEVEMEPKRSGSRSREHAPRGLPREGCAALADLGSEESPMVGNSDVALAGSQRYSQQATDVDLDPTFTKDSISAVAGEDMLSVPNKRQDDWESLSGGTEYSYFEEAYHTSEISPSLEADSSNMEWDM